MKCRPPHCGFPGFDSAFRTPRSALESAFRIPHSAFNGAFTLIEIVIAAALMSLILASAYVCLNAAFESKKVVEPRVEILQNARVAMALLTADLRGACPLTKDYNFLGMHRMIAEMPADNLDFATHNYTPKHEHESDFCEESIFLEKDPATGRFTLLRRRNPMLAPDPLSGGSRETIATGLVGAQFEYFDGLDWYDTWGEISGVRQQTSQRQQPNLAGMPEAVRVTLWFDSDPGAKIDPLAEQPITARPLVFQSTVCLVLADAQAADAGGSDSTSAGAQPDASQAGSVEGGNQ
jgi:prepilin-type N-terminal cleavage/methylation domain-containing protein